MQIKALVTMLSIAMFFSIAMPIFAEQAPVFDADKPSDFIDAPTQANNEGPARPSNEDASSQAQVPTYSSSLNADQRLMKLEQQINNLQNNDQFSRVESLQKEIQTLRGQVEELTHQVQQVQTQQRTQYTDLDKRLAQQNSTGNISKEETPDVPSSSTTTNASTPTNAVTAAPFSPDAAAKPVSIPVIKPNVEKNDVLQPNVAEEQEIYQTAYNLIKEKKYNDAVNALQKMLKKYPSGQFAANAHYWLGELYGLMGKNDNALTEFETVVKRFPKSPRISDAQLKLGLIYASRSKWVDAKTAFKKVISQYPGTASAQLASEQLKQIKLAGH